MVIKYELIQLIQLESMIDKWDSAGFLSKNEGIPEDCCLDVVWLVVEPPLWKIWKSNGIIVPNIWKKCSKPPTSCCNLEYDDQQSRLDDPLKYLKFSQNQIGPC